MVPKLSVVIVNWNMVVLLRKCLASIQKYTTGLTYEVIVVDNGSTDGSPEMVRSEFPDVRLFGMDENLGFTKGNNIGIRASKGEYVLILNSDTEITENAFLRIIEFLDENPHAIGAVCRLVDLNGRQQPSFFRFESVFSKWFFFSVAMLSPLPLRLYEFDGDPERVQKTDWIIGAAMMIRGEPLREIGGFDEKIFIFSEDSDLCMRLSRATGKAFYYFPGATIIHVGGVSYAGGSIFYMRCSFRSTCYYFYKHQGMRSALKFKNATRFAWSLTLFALVLMNLLALGKSPRLRKGARIYLDMLGTRADCLSGMS